MVVGLLALDLISSPLHAHHHDGAWSPETAQSVALCVPGQAHEAQVDHVDPPAFGHSISALRAPGLELAAETSAQPGLPPHPTSNLLRADVGATPARGHSGTAAPPGSHRSLPPDSRAPPARA
jgi:hypothetical protein